MQLKKFKKISGVLSAAACTLVGTDAHAEEASARIETESEQWVLDGAVMYYSEPDRVSALEGVLQASKDFGDEHVFSGKVIVDSLTGASANGALPQKSVQTFTRPSGNGQYEAAAGDTPLDDTFKDTRVQLNGQWTQPIAKDLTVSTGLHFSREFDYTSVALNASIAKDLNQKNTTFSFGASFSFDVVDPHGGRPVPFSAMVDRRGFDSEEEYRAAFDATRQVDGEDTKNTADIILGLTQVISRQWITQFNLGASSIDGYLTDPFKLLSLVNADGVAQEYLYEYRPSSRSKAFFYTQSRYHFSKSILDISYRFTRDDWGVSSHTIDTHFRIPISKNSYLQPHFRFYDQTAADFFQLYLLGGDELPEYASADYRVGELTAYTVGLKYGKRLRSGREFSARFEYYQQSPTGEIPVGVSELERLDLYPRVDAVILQFGCKF